MNPLKPWAYGPFELICHAESHRRDGDDFDRRIALIGFDNAIEVAITTYLSLHPIQRGNRQYHGGSSTVPQARELQKIREAAIWVFSVLYDVPLADVEIAKGLEEAGLSDHEDMSGNQGSSQ